MGRLLNRTTTTSLALAIAAAVAAGTGWIALAGAPLTHPHGATWSPRTFAAAVVMWQTMMVAMMTPAVAPWVGVYARLVGDRTARPVAASISFAAGYFAIWLGYSVIAASLQALVGATRLAAPDALSTRLAGVVLIAAGVFQFSPAKQACLAHCRNPLSYLLARWKDGPIGGFQLGATHGAYCVGCCWLLMLTGFAFGVMNLAWMAVLTVVISLEQGMRGGVRLGRWFGAALIAWGIGLNWMA